MKHLPVCFLALISLLLFSVGMSPAQWYQQNSGTTRSLIAVTFPDTRNGFAVGDGGIILHTSDAGASWVEQVSGTTNPLHEVCFIDANTGFAVGDSGTILKTDDGGSGWSLLSTGKEYTLKGVCFVDAVTGWAVGDHWYWSPDTSDHSSIILRTTNGGVYWTQQTFADTSRLNGVYFTDVNNGWVVGWRMSPNVGTDNYVYEGLILRTTNGGADWRHQTSGTNRALYDVEFIDANIGWVVGGAVGILPRAKISHPAGDGSGIVLKTVDGGLTWMTQMDTLCEALSGVSFVDSSFGCAAGSGGLGGTIICTTDGGVNWTSQLNENLMRCSDVEFIDANTGWVVGEDVDWDSGVGFSHSGMILHTTNGGVTSVDEGHPAPVPKDFALAQNYPNPFNPVTKIRLTIADRRLTVVAVYDLLGREVALLMNEVKDPGTYEVLFDASVLASGVYVYRLSAGNHVASRTMLLMK